MAIGCTTAATVYFPDDGHFKVFDIQARDIYGNCHPQGTFLLLDYYIWTSNR